MKTGSRLLVFWRVLCAAALLAMPALAAAHAAGTSYLTIHAHPGERSVHAVWDLDVQDLDWTVDLDMDGNGHVASSEIQERRDAIGALALRHLEIRRGASVCALAVQDYAHTRRGEFPFVSLSLRGTCSEAGTLQVKNSLFFAQDASQRALVEVVSGSQRFNTILSPLSSEWAQPETPSAWVTFGRFIVQGMWHVWIGYDHIAFVVLLLLPSVLRGTREGWHNRTGVREIARDLIGVVTAFTLAHSLTLSLAATQTVMLPERPVEITIAASIVVAGLLNLMPGAVGWRLPLAFGFGLMHGFGFANALAELDTHGMQMVPLLAGFNIGVELAQLTIVAVALPLLLRLRGSSFYAARLMPAASLATAITGAAWLAARLP